MKICKIAQFVFAVLQLLGTSMMYADTPVMVYRNDGEFNVIDSKNIEHISFSRYDLDSIPHSNIVVQDVYTKDGLIRIPLSSIERVSLVTPPTRMKSGGIELDEELLSNLICVEDDLILHFNPAVLENEKIKAGAKLATLNMSEKLPFGFLGEIKTVSYGGDEVIVTCGVTNLSDVYESLFLDSDIEFSNEGYVDEIEEAYENSPQSTLSSKIKADIDNSFNIPTFRRSLALEGSLELSDMLGVGTLQELSVEVSPKLHIKSCVVIEDGRLDTSTSLIADLYLEEEISHSFTGTLEKEFSLPAFSSRIPAAPLFSLFVKGGLRVSLSGTFGLNLGFSQHYRMFASASYSSSHQTESQNPELQFQLVDKSYDAANTYGECTVKFGPFLQFGVAAITPELVNVNVEVEGGIQVDVKAAIDMESIRRASYTTDLYEMLSKPDALSVGQFRSASLNTEILGGLCKGSLSLGYDLQPGWEMPILPIFGNINAKRNDSSLTQIDVNGSFSPGLILNHNISFCLREGKEEDNNDFLDIDPTVEIDAHNLSANFRELDLDKSYTIYPLVLWEDNVILAKPNDYVQKDECKIDDVQQLGYEYISDSEAVISVEVNTVSDSKNWSIGVRGPHSDNETLGVVNVGEGRQTTRIDIPLDRDEITFDTKWPYSYSNEYTFIPYMPDNRPVVSGAYNTTLSLEYIPEEYYIVGNFQGWDVENAVKLQPLGNYKYQVTVYANVLSDGNYEPVWCKILPNVNGVDWLYQIGGENGQLNDGETNIELLGKSAYTITVDLNNFTYTVY